MTRLLASLSIVSILVAAGHAAAAGPPLVHLKLDDGSGTTAKNSGSAGATLEGFLMNMDNSNWVAGKAGLALDFDGVDEWVRFSGSIDFGAGDFTVAAWVFKRTATTSAFNSSVLMGVWDLGNLTPGDNEWVLVVGRVEDFVPVDRAVLGLEVGGSGTHFPAANTTLSLSTWHHVVGVRDGAVLRVYQDGVSVGSLSFPGGSMLDTGLSIALGVNASALVTRFYLDGLIDDVQIYDEALTSGEIFYMATNPGETAVGAPTPVPGLPASFWVLAGAAALVGTALVATRRRSASTT